MTTRTRRLLVAVLGTLAVGVLATLPAQAADLRWIAHKGGSLPANAVRGGTAADGEPVFVCLSEVNKVVQPGRVFRGNCWIAEAGKEVEVKPPFEVLVAEGGARGIWMSHSGGALPPATVKGGAASDKEPFYVCRSQVNKLLLPGKLFRGNCFIAAGKEVEVKAPNYQVLVVGTGGGVAATPPAAGPISAVPPVVPPAAPGGAPAGAAPTAASPSGDVTWAQGASTTRVQGLVGIFCRIHVPEGVVGGIVAGQKCAAGFRGKEVASAQFDVLSGNTAGLRMVAAEHPGQVPGAIVVGTVVGRKVWLCGARQPNNAYALGWTEGGPCVTYHGNKIEDFNTNLAALAPPAAK